MILLGKERKEIPPWIESLIANERSGYVDRNEKKDGGGNWGVVVALATCPICGMQHNLGESVSSITVFPCCHVFHVACLKTQFCPLCYSKV
jgi:hypothetical protein